MKQGNPDCKESSDRALFTQPSSLICVCFWEAGRDPGQWRMQPISSSRAEEKVTASHSVVAYLEKNSDRKQEGYQVLVTVISFQIGFSEISGLFNLYARKDASVTWLSSWGMKNICFYNLSKLVGFEEKKKKKCKASNSILAKLPCISCRAARVDEDCVPYHPWSLQSSRE